MPSEAMAFMEQRARDRLTEAEAIPVAKFEHAAMPLACALARSPASTSGLNVRVTVTESSCLLVPVYGSFTLIENGAAVHEKAFAMVFAGVAGRCGIMGGSAGLARIET